ncbi:elongator protein 2 [Genlisea aurea]|uniref:Elongator complex protein 2 n=1 Tax=Genlisea aurea TaxID=192259 RepID=S8DH36_9LAMI|nr:elongator protein 2 [Genlisea aurea]
MSGELTAKREAHRRIIWSCSWHPRRHRFATGSRDKTVKVWEVGGDSSSPVELARTLPPFGSSVTAVSWAEDGRLAVGMESGLIEVWSFLSAPSSSSNGESVAVVRFDPFACHVSSVRRLRWRRRRKNDEQEEDGELWLASCGDDNCVRIFKLSRRINLHHP